MNQSSSLQSKAITLGFWAALLTAIFTVLFVISTVVFLSPDWNGIEAYAQSFRSIQLVSLVPCVLFAITLVILMVSIHYYVPEEKRIFSLLGIAFSIIYATMIWINAYLQLYVVRLNILQGQLDGLALLAMPNFHSVFFALEAIGYGFLSIALLAVSPVFTGQRLANWIRGLFILVGVIGICGIILALFDRPVLILAGLGLWNLAYPVSMVLVCIYFWKARQPALPLLTPDQLQPAR